MMPIFRLILIVVPVLMLLTACPGDGGPGGGGGGSTRSSTAGSGSKRYPVPMTERKYRDVHEKVKEAWFLTETAYLVVADKYAASKSGESRVNVSKEIDENIFGVNKTVENLFKEAIEAEPENPWNYAAYAFYLKPRKRLTDKGGYIPTDAEALEQVDKAIELWPDDAGFYMLKALILTAPHQAHDYFRSGAMEEVAVAAQMDKVRDALGKAERYYPDNHYINYWKALLIYRYTPADERPATFDTLLREINAGNDKKEGRFYFAPPLRPWQLESKVIVLDATVTEPLYYDHWYQTGTYNMPLVNEMVLDMMGTLKWPRDKDAIADLMFFYYNLGRTDPFDRTYFAMQHAILEQVRLKLDKGHADAGKLAHAHRFLSEQYRTVAGKLYGVGLIDDPTMVDVRGINRVESGPARQHNIKSYMQGPQASYLKHFGELLDVKFPLPDDPEKW